MSRTHLSKQPTKLGGDLAVRSHAYKRIDRMTLMGLSLRKLITLGKLTQPVTLTCRAASLQAGRGSKELRTEAAHNLPRDLAVNGRSFWEWAKEVDVHPRIKLQLFYSSAATMNVAKECNYLDSRWEQWGLPSDWQMYLENCAKAAHVSGAGTLGDIATHAENFKGICEGRLSDVIQRIRERSYYKGKEAALETIFESYETAVSGYDPTSRLQHLWQIYELPKYQ